MNELRRRPVPREWREEHHWLDLRSHSGSHVVGRGRTYRSRGRCSCGEEWPKSKHTDNLSADDVRDYWLDHVAEAYHGEDWLIVKDMSHASA